MESYLYPRSLDSPFRTLLPTIIVFSIEEVGYAISQPDKRALSEAVHVIPVMSGTTYASCTARAIGNIFRSQWRDRLNPNNLPQETIDSIDNTDLASLLLNRQTDEFHSWLFDVLTDFDVEPRDFKELANKIQDNPRAKVLEVLVNKCRDSETMSPETRDSRMHVLRMLLLKSIFRPRFALLGQERDRETQDLRKRLLDELSERHRDERLRKLKETKEEEERKRQRNRRKYRLEDDDEEKEV